MLHSTKKITGPQRRHGGGTCFGEIVLNFYKMLAEIMGMFPVIWVEGKIGNSSCPAVCVTGAVYVSCPDRSNYFYHHNRFLCFIRIKHQEGWECSALQVIMSVIHRLHRMQPLCPFIVLYDHMFSILSLLFLYILWSLRPLVRGSYTSATFSFLQKHFVLNPQCIFQ